VQSLESKITNRLKDKGQSNTSLHLFPFKKEHLFSYSGKNNKIQYLYQFIGIALIIILIASINFVNLSISKAEQRRPEIGIRKALGAKRKNVLGQFLAEKGLMIFFSLLISLLLIAILLPLFQNFSGKKIIFDSFLWRSILLMLLAVLTILLALSVVYPSVYLASFHPIHALKSHQKRRSKISLKSLLVVVQFTLATILISGSIIIARQIRYINQYDLGYKQANLIFLELSADARSKFEAIKQKMTGITGVESITCSDKLPFWGGNSSWGHDWEGKDPNNRVLICKMNVDNNYFKTMGITFVDGRNFPDYCEKVLNVDDIVTPEVILNEEAIRRMGIQNPVGKYFSPWNVRKGTIIGIVNDFHFESLHSQVEPLLLLPLLDNPAFIIARINPQNFSQTIDQIKKAWSEIVPRAHFEMGFFDDRLAEMYTSEIKISGLFKFFSIIAIFLSCIGLFGLSLFIIEQRKKEVGIRKVNGAKTSEVMILLNKDFVQWVVLALLIAIPIAYLIMNKWLENFAFRVGLSAWIFAVSGIIALIIALFTVSWQSWRAAVRNPVEALRYE
ncbi:MAG TPA: FtsX-like permease family protein, partial [Prolixibacteraceae bacterium]|nr:FtsX-like permease family protein [Prolixibacteraceae bacterium]